MAHTPAAAADAVEVGELVSHDKDVGGVGDQLAQRAGHDPALDLGTPLQLLGVAAENSKLNLFLMTTWSPPRERGHFHREGGVLEELLEGIGVPADADGEGGRHALGVEHAPHRLQYREFSLPQGARNRSSKRKRYRSRSYLHSRPPVGLHQALICSSMALTTEDFSLSLMPFISSS